MLGCLRAEELREVSDITTLEKQQSRFSILIHVLRSQANGITVCIFP